MRKAFRILGSVIRDARMHLGILTEAAFVLVLAGAGLVICLIAALI
jgi:hypothetical protein